jgi:predicted phosphohydrolase
VLSGNISNDIGVLHRTLRHLSGLYHGVFFIDGTLENEYSISRDTKIKEIQSICSNYRNVIYLHNNVVVIDGIAIVGINGWQEKYFDFSEMIDFQQKLFKYEDINYLEKTLEKLQLHNDVRKIVLISNCIPLKELFFKEKEPNTDDFYAGSVLDKDTEKKVTIWVYGSDNKMVDTVINGVKYVNNSKFDRDPYYPKRIEIKI